MNLGGFRLPDTDYKQPGKKNIEEINVLEV
jgi:hypothetical protein